MIDVSDPTITDIGGQSVEELRDMSPTDIGFGRNRAHLQSDLLSDRIFAHEESLEDLKVEKQNSKPAVAQRKPVVLPDKEPNKKNALITKELMQGVLSKYR